MRDNRTTALTNGEHPVEVISTYTTQYQSIFFDTTEEVSITATKSLCLSGGTPYQIGTACAIGYYCPHYDASDPGTYPAVCPATDKCTLLRLQTWFCSAQGTYEPVLCPKGYYCPTPTEIHICPEGHYCPRGQYEPIPCGWMTKCPEGSFSKYENSSLVIVAIVDAVMIILYFAVMRMRKRHLLVRDERLQLLLPPSQESESGRKNGDNDNKKKNKKKSYYFVDKQDALTPSIDLGRHNAEVTRDSRETNIINHSEVVSSEERCDQVNITVHTESSQNTELLTEESSSKRHSPVPVVSRDAGLSNTEEMKHDINAPPSLSHPSPIQQIHHVDVIDYHCPASTELLCNHFEIARGDNLSPIEIKFENLSLTIPMHVSRSKEGRKGKWQQWGQSTAVIALLWTPVKYLIKLYYIVTLQWWRERHSQPVSTDANQTKGKETENGKQATEKPRGKVILQGVTGKVEPGKVLAIMGPSGAGKTVLLTTLLGQQNKSWIRGGLLSIHGKRSHIGEDEDQTGMRSDNADLRAYRHVIGYVPQEDIMLRELSVYDNILYSALIRLPHHWQFEEKQRHASTVIAALELTEVQDLVIGTELKRGISGGQRKRCNIGIELAAAPALLFLDEPTSGLDSTSAMHICQVLKDLAHISSLSIAMVIHQPRVEIWHALDDLLLLAPGGRTIYQGPQRLVMHYLETHGIRMHGGESAHISEHVEGESNRSHTSISTTPISPTNDNPADALMDCIADEASLLVDLWQRDGPATVESLRERAMTSSLMTPLTMYSPPAVTHHYHAHRPHHPHKTVLLPRRRILSTVSKEEILPFHSSSRRHGDASERQNRQRQNIKLRKQLQKSDKKEDQHSGCDDGGYFHESFYLHETSFAWISEKRQEEELNNQKTHPDNHDNDDIRIIASFSTQVYLSCKRSCWKQIANWNTFVLEIALAIFGGGVMGSLVNLMYQGVLKKPYVLLSPTPVEHLIFLFFFSVGLAVSLAAASVGVSVFGEETAIYRREVLVGHNHLAYYLGVTIAQTPRLLLNGLHFAWLCHIIRQPLTPFNMFFIIIFLIYFAVYGLAAFVSMLVERQNAALLAVVLALLLARMTNRSEIPERVQWFSASRWAAEAIFDIETKPYRHIMQVEEYSAPDAGYTLGRIPFDLAMMFLVGIFYRVLALISMLWVNRRILSFPVWEGIQGLVMGGSSMKRGTTSRSNNRRNHWNPKKTSSSQIKGINKDSDKKIENDCEYTMLANDAVDGDDGDGEMMVIRESDEDRISDDVAIAVEEALKAIDSQQQQEEDALNPQVNAV